MSKRTFVILAAVFSLSAAFSVLALAQSPTTTSSSSSSTEDQGIRRYRVGPGDILDVRVFGQPDLNSTVEIDEDGTISSLPFIEDPIPAKCRNEKEIQKSITEAYSKYLVKPRVSVRITERRSRPPAVVFGAVRNAASFKMMRRVRLHELLATAGGITVKASGTIQIVHTEPELCAEEDDVMRTVTASLTDKSTVVPAAEKSPAESDIGQLQIYQIASLKTGLGKDDPYIRPGDIVIVTEGEPIYMTGAVVSPRELIMKDGLTLGHAIAMTGGVTRQAKANEVHVYRKKEGKIGPEDLRFDFEAIKKGKQPDVLLQPYDIVEVRTLGTFAPKNLADFFLNTVKGTVGYLPQMIIY
jgi:polysaccharide export outer membrane protein